MASSSLSVNFKNSTDQIAAQNATQEVIIEIERLQQSRWALYTQILQQTEEFKKQSQYFDDQLQIKCSEWDRLVNKVQNVAQSWKLQKVKLNVGGTLFESTVKDLVREKPTFFSCLFSGTFDVKLDENEAVFINRPSRYFEIILRYLHQEDIRPMLQQLTNEERNLLIVEADFYQIQSLLQLLKSYNYVSCCDHQWLECDYDIESLWIADGGVKMKKASEDTEPDASVLGSGAFGTRALSRGVHRWRVRIDGPKRCWLFRLLPTTLDYDAISLGVCEYRAIGKWMDFHSLSWLYGMTSSGNICKGFLKRSYNCGQRWKVGTTVYIELDCNNGILRINGARIPVPMYTDLFPVFVLRKAGCALTLFPSESNTKRSLTMTILIALFKLVLFLVFVLLVIAVIVLNVLLARK